MDDLISARKDGSETIVHVGPDVCWTPRGGSMVKVGYCTIAFLGTAMQYSKSVRNNGNFDFQLNSRCSKSTGNEPGTGKGVKVPGYCGYCFAKVATDFVYSEGFATVKHRDPAWVNRPDPGCEEPRKILSEDQL